MASKNKTFCLELFCGTKSFTKILNRYTFKNNINLKQSFKRQREEDRKNIIMHAEAIYELSGKWRCKKIMKLAKEIIGRTE